MHRSPQIQRAFQVWQKKLLIGQIFAIEISEAAIKLLLPLDSLSISKPIKHL